MCLDYVIKHCSGSQGFGMRLGWTCGLWVWQVALQAWVGSSNQWRPEENRRLTPPPSRREFCRAFGLNCSIGSHWVASLQPLCKFGTCQLPKSRKPIHQDESFFLYTYAHLIGSVSPDNHDKCISLFPQFDSLLLSPSQPWLNRGITLGALKIQMLGAPFRGSGCGLGIKILKASQVVLKYKHSWETRPTVPGGKSLQKNWAKTLYPIS